MDQAPANDRFQGHNQSVDYSASIFNNALCSEKQADGGQQYDMSSMLGEKAYQATNKEIETLQQKLRKDSIMNQRGSCAPQGEKSLPSFMNFTQMVDRNNSTVSQIDFTTQKKSTNNDGGFQAPFNHRKMSKIPEEQQLPPIETQSTNFIPSPISGAHQNMVSQRRKLNAVYEKKLVEKSNFKNYKMGQQIDQKPQACGDKRIGTFANYSIQQSNKKQKVAQDEKSGFKPNYTLKAEGESKFKVLNQFMSKSQTNQKGLKKLLSSSQPKIDNFQASQKSLTKSSFQNRKDNQDDISDETSEPEAVQYINPAFSQSQDNAGLNLKMYAKRASIISNLQNKAAAKNENVFDQLQRKMSLPQIYRKPDGQKSVTFQTDQIKEKEKATAAAAISPPQPDQIQKLQKFKSLSRNDSVFSLKSLTSDVSNKYQPNNLDTKKKSSFFKNPADECESEGSSQITTAGAQNATFIRKPSLFQQFDQRMQEDSFDPQVAYMGVKPKLKKQNTGLSTLLAQNQKRASVTSLIYQENLNNIQDMNPETRIIDQINQMNQCGPQMLPIEPKLPIISIMNPGQMTFDQNYQPYTHQIIQPNQLDYNQIMGVKGQNEKEFEKSESPSNVTNYNFRQRQRQFSLKNIYSQHNQNKSIEFMMKSPIKEAVINKEAETPQEQPSPQVNTQEQEEPAKKYNTRSRNNKSSEPKRVQPRRSTTTTPAPNCEDEEPKESQPEIILSNTPDQLLKNKNFNKIMKTQTRRRSNKKKEDEVAEEPVIEVKNRKKREITRCPHPEAKHYAKGMCNHCYHLYGRSSLATKCEHKDRLVYAKGMCQNCYFLSYNTKKKEQEQKAQKKRNKKKV